MTFLAFSLTSFARSSHKKFYDVCCIVGVSLASEHGSGRKIDVAALGRGTHFGEFADTLSTCCRAYTVDVIPAGDASLNVRQCSVSGPKNEGFLTADLSQRIGNILRRVSKSLQPQNLSQMDRTEIRECFLALEQMKMLLSELEILQLSKARSQTPMSSGTHPMSQFASHPEKLDQTGTHTARKICKEPT